MNRKTTRNLGTFIPTDAQERRRLSLGLAGGESEKARVLATLPLMSVALDGIEALSGLPRTRQRLVTRRDA